MRRKIVPTIMLLLLAMLTLTLNIQLGVRAEKTEIVIGVSHALTGPFAPGTPYTQGRAFHMWVDQVNADGGIYVEDEGKKLPIRLIEYDDAGDPMTSVGMYEKLITVDNVDLILPPYSTGVVLAVAPIVNDYEYPMIGIACCAYVLKTMKLPYYFYMLPQVWDQAADLANVLENAGVETVSIIYVSEEHGIEMTVDLQQNLIDKGIEILMFESYPMDVADMVPLVSEAMTLDADAFIAVSYPPDSMLLTGTVMAMDYNPKTFFIGVASSYPWYRDAFTSEAVEGIMGWGSWSPKQTQELQDWTDEYIAYNSDNWVPAEVAGIEPCYWATAYTWASLQVLQQSVEKAGTLNRATIRDTLETETFDTILGPVYFFDDLDYPEEPYHYHNAIIGTIGQWHLGEFEVLAPLDQATMSPIYPKFPWSWAAVPDVTRDGIVNILDISLAAMGFGSSAEPYDPRYSAIADIDKNGVINILDIAAIAMEFGTALE